MGDMSNRQLQSQQLRRALNLMFPEQYIKLYHRPPHSVCSLLNTKHRASGRDDIDTDPTTEDLNDGQWRIEASTEPSSRAAVSNLRESFEASLVEHQAKPVGLCPIRRAIYDQCFDEIIRQVTVGCVEQGLLLFRLRNELRMTIDCYRRAYESGVSFGLKKAVESRLELEESRSRIEQLEEFKTKVEKSLYDENKVSELTDLNKQDSHEHMKAYYETQLANKDQIISQQRNIIKSITQKPTRELNL